MRRSPTGCCTTRQPPKTRVVKRDRHAQGSTLERPRHRGGGLENQSQKPSILNPVGPVAPWPLHRRQRASIGILVSALPRAAGIGILKAAARLERKLRDSVRSEVALTPGFERVEAWGTSATLHLAARRGAGTGGKPHSSRIQSGHTKVHI